MRKYVLLRPKGGLHDIFNQVYLCGKYCRKYNRTLIIDSQKCDFHDEFSNYFSPISLDAKPFTSWISDGDFMGLSSYPEGVNVEISDYQIFLTKESSVYKLASNGMPITFNFNHDYQEEILIHHSCGGGNHGANGFGYFLVNEVIQRKLFERLDSINGSFVGIHIRNTDLKTDYQSHFAGKLSKIGTYPRLFIASDDAQALKFFKDQGIDFHTFSKTISSDGNQIHYGSFAGDIKTRNTEAILDVLTLSAAKKLIFTTTETTKPSGFVRLALGLKKQKYVKKLRPPARWNEMKLFRFGR